MKRVPKMAIFGVTAPTEKASVCVAWLEAIPGTSMIRLAAARELEKDADDLLCYRVFRGSESVEVRIERSDDDVVQTIAVVARPLLGNDRLLGDIEVCLISKGCTSVPYGMPLREQLRRAGLDRRHDQTAGGDGPK